MLESWSDGAAKSAILDFVARVTREGGPDFVRPAERIATFDNDGTLWCEQPVQVQVFFLRDRVAQLAKADPQLAQQPVFKAFLASDLAALKALGKQGILELFAKTHAGMTDEEFVDIARHWFAGARHLKFGRPYRDCTYQPQLELLDYLRANSFRTFIVSGGGVDLMRAISEEFYGIPPENVIGSSFRTEFAVENGVGVLRKLGELGSFDDREVKPANIGLHIGRRPILAFGNSDGDLAMLRYVKTGPGPRLALLLHHDDAQREVAYDRDFKLSPLGEALDKADQYGIQVVSMAKDWANVFRE